MSWNWKRTPGSTIGPHVMLENPNRQLTIHIYEDSGSTTDRLTDKEYDALVKGLNND